MLKNKLADFSNLEREYYMKAVVSVACSDGTIHEKEKEFVNAQAELFSIDPNPYWEKPEKDLSFLGKAEISRMNSLVIIRDCIVLGHIEKNFADTERKRVNQIAEYLKLGKSDVKAIEKWLKELWSVLEKGKTLFEEENL